MAINFDDVKNIWVYAEQRHGKLMNVALELIGEGYRSVSYTHLFRKAGQADPHSYGGKTVLLLRFLDFLGKRLESGTIYQSSSGIYRESF